MKRRAMFRLLFALASAVAVVLIVSIISLTNNSEDLYAVTAQQWEAAFGDAAHIQTIYRNVTVEIGGDGSEKPMRLATAGGGVMLDYEAGDMKLICVPADSGFTSYLWQYSTQQWNRYDGKADGVDDLLAKELPNYVDTAMAGLQGEFGNARYDADGRCYFGDEKIGYMVYTTVTAGGLTYEMWLPVMDGANKAMKDEPYTYATKYGDKTVEAMTMFDVNKTVMRCLVKNLSMFGLGLYIYSGEDLPQDIRTYVCADCGAEVDSAMAARTHKAFGVHLCKDCGVKRSEAKKNEGAAT